MHGNLFPRSALDESLSVFFTGGWVGVDLFFAISGFVIARSFLPRALDSGAEVRYRTIACRFWITRFFRLAPSAWLWLLIILVLCLTYNKSGVFGTLETNAYWTLSGVLNFSNYLLVQYFGVQKPGVSFVYWSLSLEEQFYLVFPIVVWLFKRRVSWFFAALALAQIFSQRGLYGMMFRTDAIALGVLVAHFHGGNWQDRIVSIKSGWPARGLVMFLVFLLFYIGTVSQDELPVRVGLVAIVSAYLVWLCAGSLDMFAGHSAAGRSFLWLGQRSYAMYLIHIPVMFFLRETAFRLHWDIGRFPLLSGLMALFLIAGLAALNYRWVEDPLRRKGKTVAAKFDFKPL
jgi:peptidoglycan/LPS O-acetylase OafA/YrhL